MVKLIFSVIFISYTLLYINADHNSTEAHEQKIAASNPVATKTTPSFWPDSWRGGLSEFATTGGLIISGLFIIVGLVWLLAGRSFRMCRLFGNCERQAIEYNDGGNLQDPAMQANAFNDVPPFYSGYRLVQKRSINFLAPMLKKLANTLETMEQAEKTNKKE